MANRVNMRFRVKDNWRRMIKLERDVLNNTRESVDDAADALVKDIRDNWSAVSPSRRGSAPGVKTGNLDSSVQKESTTRDALGRFAGKDGAVQFVTIDTEKGKDPQGRGQYAGVLELSPRYNRPFVLPAVNRLKNNGQLFFSAAKIIGR